MQGTMPGARRRGRPRTPWIDNIKMWTGLSVEESIRMTEDRDKWRKYVHGLVNPLIEDGYRTEQNRYDTDSLVLSGGDQHDEPDRILSSGRRTGTVRGRDRDRGWNELVDELLDSSVVDVLSDSPSCQQTRHRLLATRSSAIGE